ncbi:MAG: phosphotransferase enzyme family protein [Fibrobacterota bacterium]
MSLSAATAEAAAHRFGCTFQELCRPALYGSPERSRDRVVFRDNQGSAWLLERLHPNQETTRRLIAALLERVAPDIPCAPYRRDRTGDFVTTINGAAYQIQPWIKARPLHQPDYINDAWRGRAAAEVLTRLHGLSPPQALPRHHSLREYIRRLTATIRVHRPALAQRIDPIHTRLQRWFIPLEALPQVLSHGDPHPQNILWGDTTIQAIIDWEFCSMRPLLYDAALLFGCIASEGPLAWCSPMAKALQTHLQKHPPYAQHSSLFGPMVCALRFAWLSEWLRKKDREMLSFEVMYMNHLCDIFDL